MLLILCIFRYHIRNLHDELPMEISFYLNHAMSVKLYNIT